MIFIQSFILLLFSFSLSEESAEQILSKLQTKFESIESFKAEFVSKGAADVKGIFYHGKKENFKIELSSSIIVCDGKTIWNYDKKLNRVVINIMGNDESAFSLHKYIYEYPQKCKLQKLESETGSQALLLTPVISDLGFNYAKIFVNSEYLISKIEVEDYTGTVFQFELSNIRLDIDLPESFFKFTALEGTKIIDLR